MEKYKGTQLTELEKLKIPKDFERKTTKELSVVYKITTIKKCSKTS